VPGREHRRTPLGAIREIREIVVQFVKAQRFSVAEMVTTDPLKGLEGAAAVAEWLVDASFVRMPDGSVGDRRLVLLPVESRAWRQSYM
jgi:hypothetical protein